MSMTNVIGIAVLAIIMSSNLALAQDVASATPPSAKSTATASAAGKSLRGSRYCELLVPTRESGANTMTLQVFNTQGLNDCPESAWNAINARAEAKRLGVPIVIKNGPRYLAYDRISAEIDGSLETFGDLEARIVATLDVPAGSLPQSQPAYTDMVIDRNTEYVYFAGKPVFELVAPDGRVYVMQTYVAANDPAGDFSGLKELGNRLTLPDGWQFREIVPDQDLHAATANGQATVIRDDLENTYQLLTSVPGTPVPKS